MKCSFASVASMATVFSLFLCHFNEATANSYTRQSIFSAVEQATQIAAEDEDRKYTIDPQIVLDMAENANVFFWNFCTDDAPSRLTLCNNLIEDPDNLAVHVGAYLDDVIKLSPQVETLASRLARSIGLNMAMAGYPSEPENLLSVVSIPPELYGSEFFLVGATGLKKIGNYSKILILKPGKFELIAKRDGQQNSRTILEAIARSKVMWISSEMNVAVGGAVRIESTPLHYCDAGQKLPSVESLYPFNWGRVTFAESEEQKKSYLTPAALQTVIDIEVVDETGQCNSSCLDGLGIAFAEAISVWIYGCERCDMSALSVIRVGNQLWLNRKYAERIRSFRARTALPDNIDASTPLDEEIQSYFTPKNMSFHSGGLVGYEQLSGDDSLIYTLCGLNVSAPQWIRSAQSLVCPLAPRTPIELRPRLVIKEKETDCGSAKYAVACGKPNGDIQLALEGYRFLIPSRIERRPVILTSETGGMFLRITPIILHEIGHWFGVPHNDAVGLPNHDVMASVYQKDRDCLSEASLIMLNNAVDIRWHLRSKGQHSLRVAR